MKEDLKYSERIIKDLKTEFGIDVREVVREGILHVNDARKWLVKKLYYKKAKENRTYADIKYELSIEYDISVSSIEKMIYRK
jgi:hypothetical protein